MRLAFSLLLLVSVCGCETRADWTIDDWKAQWKEDAERGDADAAFELAFHRFMDGEHASAIAEFERLAEGDHPNPQVFRMLAYVYQEGEGVGVDYERAAYWLGRSAAIGDGDAARDVAAYRARTDSSRTAR